MRARLAFAILASLLPAAAALAQEVAPVLEDTLPPEPDRFRMQILAGPGTARVGPAPDSTQISLRAEFPLRRIGGTELSVVVPLDYSYGGDHAFGLDFERNLLEMAPSARLRVAPDKPVRFYADGGLGVAIAASELDTEDLDGELPSSGLTGTNAGVVIRVAAGLEFAPGLADLTLVVEPVSMRFYDVEGAPERRYTPMVGVGTRF